MRLKDPTDPKHGLDLKTMATAFAETYKAEKRAAKEAGQELRALPGVHHPVFKGKPVNHDPRERFIAELHGRTRPLQRVPRVLPRTRAGAVRRRRDAVVFCVNIDAVIAALLLALLWSDYTSGALAERDLETAAFNVFLYGRMIGAAAEIDDHLNRGRNMDTRTPEEQWRSWSEIAAWTDPMDVGGRETAGRVDDANARDARRHQSERRHLRRLGARANGHLPAASSPASAPRGASPPSRSMR